jgi:Colicin V production protein
MRPEPAAAAGSPLWQAIFFSFAIVLILFEVVRGWRLGLPRQLVRVAGLAVAYAAAFLGGKLVVPLVRPFLKLPDIILSASGGVVLALVVYVLVVSIGTILFKRIGQQNSRLVRVVYGLSGAFIGLFFSAFLLWMIVVSIRAIGAVADGQVRSRASSQATDIHAADVRRRFLGESAEQSATLAMSLARLKNSLELGTVGEAVKRTDPVPSQNYETLGEVGSVFSNPKAAQRFLMFPGARELSENPKIVALRNDPEISDMIAQGRVLDLLQDRRIIDAANDSTLREQIKKFDLQRALDYSIQEE